MKLTNPSLRSLDFAFAAIVAGIPPDIPDNCGNPLRGLYRGENVPHYTRSMDAVIPWLEKQWCRISGPVAPGDEWSVHLGMIGDEQEVKAEAPTLPHAAVVALLRAKGITITDPNP